MLSSEHFAGCPQVHRDAPSCTILCTYAEEAHAGHSATMLGQEAFTEYRAALLEVNANSLANPVAAYEMQLIFRAARGIMAGLLGSSSIPCLGGPYTVPVLVEGQVSKLSSCLIPLQAHFSR